MWGVSKSSRVLLVVQCRVFQGRSLRMPLPEFDASVKHARAPEYRTIIQKYKHLTINSGHTFVAASRLRFNDPCRIGDTTINQTDRRDKGQEVSHLSWVHMGPMAPHSVALGRRRVLSLGAAGSAVFAPRPDSTVRIIVSIITQQEL